MPSCQPAYHLVGVVSVPQKILLLAMQSLFLVTLLYLSVKIGISVLSNFLSLTVTFIFLVGYGTYIVFWQGIYIYRILNMKRAVLNHTEPPHGFRIAMATTIVPSHEGELLKSKLESMVGVNHAGNRLDCWVLDEEDDAQVKSLVAEFQLRYGSENLRVLHFSRKGVLCYNEKPTGRRFRIFQKQQKAGNINAWLNSISLNDYDVITFLDLDHFPLQNFYEKVLPFFHNPEIAFVQGPEAFRNRDQNFITRAATFERDMFFGIVHRTYFGLGMTIVIGAHTTFLTSTLRNIGGYYPVHLTEDYLMMLKLRALRQRGIFLDEVIAIGELPSSWQAYIKQQYRWAAGGLDLLLRYFPSLFSSYSLKERLYYFLLLNYYVWGTFYVFGKIAFYMLIFLGLLSNLGTVLILKVIVCWFFMTYASFLWERQFFIEKEKRTYFIQNAIMNNFLGCHYFLALLKAIITPNRPFAVTPKKGAQHLQRRRIWALISASIGFVIVDLFGISVSLGLVVPSINPSGSSAGSNMLLFFLLISVITNLSLIVMWRQLQL